LDGWIGSIWHLYALRSDLREALFGEIDAAHALDGAVQRASGAEARAAAAHRPTPDRFEGTYDLSPLDGKNVSVHFLRETIALLAEEHIPALAILTPTNHTLLHEYIDVPEYRKNLAYVRALLAAGDARVLDLDARFPAAEFIDNDHLTARGNRRLAAALEPLLAR
jgi:lysophospholipase L1-like esterase